MIPLLSEKARRWLASAEGATPEELQSRATVAAQTGLVSFADALAIKAMADQISQSGAGSAGEPQAGSVVSDLQQQIQSVLSPQPAMPPSGGIASGMGPGGEAPSPYTPMGQAPMESAPPVGMPPAGMEPAGIASLPVSEQMFNAEQAPMGMASGGIVAFQTGDLVKSSPYRMFSGLAEVLGEQPMTSQRFSTLTPEQQAAYLQTINNRTRAENIFSTPALTAGSLANMYMGAGETTANLGLKLATPAARILGLADPLAPAPEVSFPRAPGLGDYGTRFGSEAEYLDYLKGQATPATPAAAAGTAAPTTPATPAAAPAAVAPRPTINGVPIPFRDPSYVPPRGVDPSMLLGPPSDTTTSQSFSVSGAGRAGGSSGFGIPVPAMPEAVDEAAIRARTESQYQPLLDALGGVDKSIEKRGKAAEQENADARRMALAMAGFRMAEAASQPGASFLGSAASGGVEYAEGVNTARKELVSRQAELENAALDLALRRAEAEVNVGEASQAAVERAQDRFDKLSSARDEALYRNKALEISAEELAIRRTTATREAQETPEERIKRLAANAVITLNSRDAKPEEIAEARRMLTAVENYMTAVETPDPTRVAMAEVARAEGLRKALENDQQYINLTQQLASLDNKGDLSRDDQVKRERLLRQIQQRELDLATRSGVNPNMLYASGFLTDEPIPLVIE